LPGKDDRTPSDPMQTPALTPNTLKIRRDISLPHCSIKGCNDVPTERLPQRMGVPNLIWCKAHGDIIARMIGERNYQDFVAGMRQEGIKGEPIAQSPGRTEDRRCAIPRCKRETVTGSDLFSPYKSPGMVWVCAPHSEILQQVVRKQNGHRLVHELSLTGERKSDPERRKRVKAVLSAYAKHNGKPKYIECVCQDLQTAHIKMPPRWLEKWSNSFGLRFEPYEWLRAYQDKRIKGRIQKYISKVCKLRVRPPLK
jgi:hypothetical protein